MIGFLVVDKDAGWTSHDVVARCRRLLGERRIGHAGTLDPGATGVLVLGVGPATRLLGYLSGEDKEYVGEVVLGVTTTTLDDEGDVTSRFDMSEVSLEDVRAAAAAFVGEIDQRVPMVSAVKVGGRRLHRLAREGTVVETPVRRVRIGRLDVEAGPEPGVFAISVACSSGTYVRALAADLGAALGGGAHLRRLRRVRSGLFGIDDARPLGVVEAELGAGRPVLRPATVGLPFGTVAVADDVAADVAHGRPLSRDRIGDPGPGPVALVDRHGDLLAVYDVRAEEATARPSVVLAASGRPAGPG